jgi:hypothetical protein
MTVKTLLKILTYSIIGCFWTMTLSAEDKLPKEDEITKLVQDAFKAYGKDYETIRDKIIKDADVSRPVLEKLRKDESWDIRMTAYFFIGWINHEKTYNEILVDEGILQASLRHVFSWGKYGIEIMPLLLERVAKDKEHSYSLKLRSIRGDAEEGLEQSRRDAISYKLVTLLPVADKEFLLDVNILCPNERIRKFLWHILEYPYVDSIDSMLFFNPALADVFPRSKTIVNLSDVIKPIIEKVTLDQLRKAINENKEETDKVSLFLALHLKGDDKGLIELLKIIPEFKSTDAKLKSIKVLGELADKTMVNDLEKLNEQIDDSNIKDAIAEAIDKINIRHEKAKEKQEKDRGKDDKPEQKPDKPDKKDK